MFAGTKLDQILIDVAHNTVVKELVDCPRLIALLVVVLGTAAQLLMQPYTHIAIQVTLEDPQGSKQDKTVRFFTGPKMEAWVRSGENARWCLLWITPYSREKRTSTQGRFTFDEMYLRFSDLSGDMHFLDNP